MPTVRRIGQGAIAAKTAVRRSGPSGPDVATTERVPVEVPGSGRGVPGLASLRSIVTATSDVDRFEFDRDGDP